MISKEDMMRDFILQNCEEIFTKNGYKNTSMDMIAEKCGISKPTLYNYFKSKYELFMGLYMRFKNELIEKTNALLAQDKDKTQTIEEIISFSFSFMQQKRDFLKMMMREHHLIVHDNFDELLDQQTRIKHEIVKPFGAFLKSIVKPEILREFGSEMIGASLSNMLEGVFWDSILKDSINKDKQISFIMKLLKNGILA